MPNPILDAVIVLWLNVAVIRRVAAIQGLRPRLLASGALLRRTAAAIVAAGAIEGLHDLTSDAMADGLLQRVAGRVGEGTVNGLLTVRVGLAALDACRPIPFRARPRPATLTVAREAVAGCFEEK